MVRVTPVDVLAGFTVRLGFADGTVKEIDLLPYLRGPIFQPIRDHSEVFRSVKVDHELGTPVWDSGTDIDPDVLYGNRTPAWMEDETSQPERPTRDR